MLLILNTLIKYRLESRKIHCFVVFVQYYVNIVKYYIKKALVKTIIKIKFTLGIWLYALSCTRWSYFDEFINTR